MHLFSYFDHLPIDHMCKKHQAPHIHARTHAHACRDAHKAAVLWQRRQVILSREECHCNPLMLLSHPRRVRVSVPALIYSGRRKWREWAMCSSRHPINAFTMLLQCQPGDDISVISHSVVMFSLCRSFSITRRFPLLITALTPTSSPPSFVFGLPLSFLSPSSSFPIRPSPCRPISLSSVPYFTACPCHKIDCNYCVAVSRMD